MKFRIKMFLAAIVALFGAIAYSAPSSAMTVAPIAAAHSTVHKPTDATPIYYYRYYRRHYYRPRYYYRPHRYYYHPRYYYRPHYYYRPRHYYRYGY